MSNDKKGFPDVCLALHKTGRSIIGFNVFYNLVLIIINIESADAKGEWIFFNIEFSLKAIFVQEIVEYE